MSFMFKKLIRDLFKDEFLKIHKKYDEMYKMRRRWDNDDAQEIRDAVTEYLSNEEFIDWVVERIKKKQL